MHLSVISNPTSPPDTTISGDSFEPMSTSEDEDIANNNDNSLSSSTTESDLSSNTNFGLFGNGNLNELGSTGSTETEAEGLIRKAASLLERTANSQRRPMAQSLSLHSVRSAPDWRRRNDREDIRQKLAMLDIGDGDDGIVPSPSPKAQSPFETEVADVQVVLTGAERPDPKPTPFVERVPRKSRAQRPTSFPCRRKPIRLGCMTPISTDDQSFTARKARLMAEARLALAQAPQVAQRQVTEDKERRAQLKRGRVSSLLLPQGCRRFTRPVLSKLNMAKVQLIVNDLHTQIQQHNEELMRLLQQRDELNMERDGKLVDIEDLDRIQPDSNTSLLSTLVTT